MGRRVSWERLPATVAALATVVALGSCAPKKQEVVFWQFWPTETLQPLVREFERQNPGLTVRVEQLAWAGGADRIAAAIDSGRVPDLCEVGSTWLPRMLATGQLVDWSAGIADIRPRLRGWEMAMEGEAVYGVPWLLGTRALFYNKMLLARAHLDPAHPPETWDELSEAAAAIEKLGNGVHGFGVQNGERGVLFKKFMPFAWGNGGHILSDDLTAAVFDSPENRAALDYYKSLRTCGLVANQDTLDREFKAGRLGFEISGAWLIKSIPRDAPALRYGVALVPRPALDRGTPASFAGGEVLVGFRRSKRPEPALRLARFLAEPAHSQALAEALVSVQPAYRGADTTAYYRTHPAEQTMIRQFETAYFTPSHPAWAEMEAA
ncbi:MAG TPA: extracellular solute-binding protein, partial [Dongiaceae bacterium]|nr:extracellular solute-binding protein [Dongiaceae bacterium]